MMGGVCVEASDMTDTDVFEGAHPESCPVCGATSEGEGRACPRCGHLLWFSSKQVDGVTVVELLDNRVAVMELLELLDRAVSDGSIERLVLNFAGIQQVSTAALGKLIKLRGRAEEVRGRLRLCGLHPDLRHVFRLTRLDQLFDLHDTVGEALDAFAVEGRV
jgi:anti-sigma B factor antagonist